MSNRIHLEKEQEELLCILVEAARNTPRERRTKFITHPLSMMGQHGTIHHPYLPGGHIEAHLGDIDIMASLGLLLTEPLQRGCKFDIMPLGFSYYEQMKQRSGQPIQLIEATVRVYLDSSHFQKLYPQVYRKWSEAVSLLWGSDSQQQLTTIGHLCREAMQSFATVCVEHFHPPNVDLDVAHSIARLKAVLDLRAKELGETEKGFLDALLEYWRRVSDLVQRQEHGAQKEGQQLIWEDGRRVVFQTAVVMFEVDRALSRSQTS